MILRTLLSRFLMVSCLMVSTTSCLTAYNQSVGGDAAKVFDRLYLTDFNTSWQSVLDALKNSHLDISNREGGFIQTKWTDNTAEKNFSDSFGNADAYLKAQYRFRVSVSKGFFNGQPVIKVSVIKEQLAQRDVLEGWRAIATDSIDETTLLYRIGRIIYIKMKIAKLEEDKARKEIESSGF